MYKIYILHIYFLRKFNNVFIFLVSLMTSSIFRILMNGLRILYTLHENFYPNYCNKIWPQSFFCDVHPDYNICSINQGIYQRTWSRVKLHQCQHLVLYGNECFLYSSSYKPSGITLNIYWLRGWQCLEFSLKTIMA